MHIGILASNVSATVGGGFTFEEETLAALSRQAPQGNHRFTIFVPPDASAPQLENAHVRVVALPNRRAWRERFRFGWSQLAKLATREGRRRRRRGERTTALGRHLENAAVDFMWYPPPAVADVPTFEIPFLTIVWDLQHRLQPFFPEVSAKMEWELRERRYATALRRASFVITGTRAGQAEIERFYQIAPERVKILPHPTPRFALEALPADDLQVLKQLAVEGEFLFYPAQLWPHKNHAGLFQAARILKDQYGLAPQIVLSGSDKGNRDYLERLAAELGIANRVRWLGFVERSELVALYRNARLMAYPSFFGPENLPPLEAFACGCPVVAARVNGSEEQLADAAVLFDPARPADIAEAIFTAWTSEPLRQKLVARGKERAARFTGDDFVRGVLSMLDEFEDVRRCWPRSAA
jgi:glycosyltransferase involved in cell wall biosynthesis